MHTIATNAPFVYRIDAAVTTFTGYMQSAFEYEAAARRFAESMTGFRDACEAEPVRPFYTGPLPPVAVIWRHRAMRHWAVPRRAGGCQRRLSLREPCPALQRRRTKRRAYLHRLAACA